MATLFRDLQPGDRVPGLGRVNSMEWIDDNRVRLTFAAPGGVIMAGTWCGDDRVSDYVTGGA
jgi:hypothetical protein